MRQIVILQLIRGIQFSDKPICGTAGQRKILQLTDECERVNPGTLSRLEGNTLHNPDVLYEGLRRIEVSLTVFSSEPGSIQCSASGTEKRWLRNCASNSFSGWFIMYIPVGRQIHDHIAWHAFWLSRRSCQVQRNRSGVVRSSYGDLWQLGPSGATFLFHWLNLEKHNPSSSVAHGFSRVIKVL